MFLTIKNIPSKSWSSEKPLNLKPKFTTFILLCFGLTLFGLGEGLLLVSTTGNSPWSVLAEGLSNILNISIGLSTFIISIIVLGFWFPLKQKPGIGTILNAILISVILDLTLIYLPYPKEFLFQFFQVLIGIFIIGIGSGLYLAANLGPGPRDGLMTGLNKQTNFSISFIRTLLELSAVGIGFFLGGKVGIGTLIYAIGIGFSVSLGLFFVGKIYMKN